MQQKTDMKYSLMENSNENRALLQVDDRCDKYDYLVAVACGAIGGIIDIFLVGSPGNSVLGKWTDIQVDNTVMSFAKKMGWSPRPGQENNVRSAIGFLENGSKKSGFNGFKVNYDQAKSPDVNNLFKMAPNNHHMLSLGHSPDIIGLFFSILNQFTSTSSFIANGQLITIATDTFELQGGNFIAKLFCGVANWFGHIMSDIAGSSGAIGRGSGVVIPFYELFGLCKFGKFSVGKDRQDLATIATRAFQEGYDFRFGLATAIPVIITDLSIRLVWALRRRFQYGKDWKACIPTHKHSDLRIMLLIGNGTLCFMDGLDAGIRSGGNFLAFFMRLNLIAWFRLVTLVLKEVCIRVGITDAMQKNIEAYKRINEALSLYLQELQKLDIELFKKETQKYNNVVDIFMTAKTDEELNKMLLELFEKNGINKPWEGDFNEHMSNKKGTLVFE